MSKETYEMCCTHWQKITEKRFCFCTIQNSDSGTIWRHDPPARVNVLFRRWSYYVSKSCNICSCCNLSSAKSNVHHSSHSDYIRKYKVECRYVCVFEPVGFIFCMLLIVRHGSLACAVYGLLHDRCNPQMQWAALLTTLELIVVIMETMHNNKLVRGQVQTSSSLLDRVAYTFNRSLVVTPLHMYMTPWKPSFCCCRLTYICTLMFLACLVIKHVCVASSLDKRNPTVLFCSILSWLFNIQSIVVLQSTVFETRTVCCAVNINVHNVHASI